MIDVEAIQRIREGVPGWNSWRQANPDAVVKLRATDFSLAALAAVNLREVDLRGSIFRSADLRRADLSGADLREADLSESNLEGAILSGANLRQATLRQTFLRGADLSWCQLGRADLSGADISNSNVYAVSAWDVALTQTTQTNLIITQPSVNPAVNIDNLELAQFIYLLLNNQKIRAVVDTITSKTVLILGRFTPERKPVLDLIRDQLRARNYLPVLLDFEKPSSRDVTETISTLAHISRFIIADITDARSLPQELAAIVPTLPSVPVVPLMQRGQNEWGMFEAFSRYPWVMPVLWYESLAELNSVLDSRVITEAELYLQRRTG
jgi:uncharacterized protein YjbI with pentapeptide repeats